MEKTNNNAVKEADRSFNEDKENILLELSILKNDYLMSTGLEREFKYLLEEVYKKGFENGLHK
ncbi:hypothetical protein ANASTE_01581 [Anaerofustis stercorihominis DSM 17244]|uniref:Uncharacterized protein n=1 Tax=Anaerofustis stercorihominis DSM 17244 TaxID=445971 RepID=B1CC81_9FIRM|nr:hypothetical protein [Anaerofustis stercorihominis]EDS71878.1 hypothetical protein ANASTE_01581 [Anaerofustis stercorihominis DSM 17244]